MSEKVQSKQLSSIEQFALIGLSGDVAITDGVTLAIPFDQILTQSGSVGNIVNPPVSDSSFELNPGLYLFQLQIDLDFSPTTVQAEILCQSGSAATQSATITSGSAGGKITMTLSALRLASETPIGSPFTLPDAVAARVTVTGASGNVQASNTQLLILPIATPAP